MAKSVNLGNLSPSSFSAQKCNLPFPPAPKNEGQQGASMDNYEIYNSNINISYVPQVNLGKLFADLPRQKENEALMS